MNYYAVISLFNGIVALWIAAYVFMKDRDHLVYKSFSFFTLSTALWAIFYAFWQLQTSKPSALFAMRLTMIPCYYIPFAFLLFVRHVIDDNPQKRKILPYLVMPALFSSIAFTPWMVEDVVPRLDFEYWPTPGVLMHFCAALFILTVAYSFWLLFNAWMRSQGARRWQLRLITLITLCAWLGGLTNWFLWYNIPIPPIPNFFVAIFLLILAYAIIRRKLFDIDTLTEIVREAKLSAIGTLAASINHEIRNPLYIIKGTSESFLTNLEENVFEDNAELRKNISKTLEKTIEQATRAIEIMKGFAVFAKQGVSQKPQRESLDLNQILENILPFIRHELALDKIRLNKQIPQDFPRFQADKRHLEEILFNLLVNACQAMKSDGGQIEINASQYNGTIQIKIEDSGPGIPADRLNQVFEPFYTTKQEGTGLGLYVTKHLVERNGGKISVKSQPGKGTSFTLEFKR